jgi:7-cyano-7-deazaguanine synthase
MSIQANAAVLVSGGIDSAVLLAELCNEYASVHPLYVRSGLIWEPTELAYLTEFLHALARANLRALAILDVPVHDVYGDHWSLTGRGVPGAQTADEAVFLPGRNLFLVSKAAVWCVLHRVDVLAIGSLKANPFGDSTPEFDNLLGQIVLRALGKPLRVIRPFSSLSKHEVLTRGRRLPLEHTFSCISPVQNAHCGKCNKCGERRRGFERAGMHDQTQYYYPLADSQ